MTRMSTFTAAALIALGTLGAAQAQTADGPAQSAAVAYHRSGHGQWMARWRALDAVGATADQKARIQAIARQAATDLKPLRAQTRTLHQQMAQLLAAPTIDARAVEGVRQQLLGAQDSASKRRVQARLDAAAVLTADQRAQLQVRSVQRRELLQRQRQEREALFGRPQA